ncbi:uncharacterized protein DFL_001454 [Arthrobotrys flagrans]|uniref:DUF5672 domain-containing protein n=1 Tax=Arthrobotrys flagrans TaxID=97331 RepID=A0A437A7X3_ARTFL|nr:hypothetical protein DFL_001454 [Arthrobotrys flagrans]
MVFLFPPFKEVTGDLPTCEPNQEPYKNTQPPLSLCMNLRQLSFPIVPFFFRRRRCGFMTLMLSTRNVLVAVTLLVLLGLITLTPSQPLTLKYGSTIPKSSRQFKISSKVAAIADTSFSPQHVPLVMHFSGVLGPEWPIVYYTSRETYDAYLKPGVANVSRVWTRALDEGRIQVRFLPTRFEMTSRKGVNTFLADKWMWEDLAPAKNVLIFQADAIICGNAHKTVDDFLEWDFIGATLAPEGRMYNGGLSLRNRDTVLRILKEHNYEEDTRTGLFKFEGEDVWYSKHMDLIGAKLPSNEVALEFACEYHFHIQAQKQPMGYHKVHKAAPSKIGEIAEWCPEIHLAAPGKLGKS